MRRFFQNTPPWSPTAQSPPLTSSLASYDTEEQNFHQNIPMECVGSVANLNGENDIVCLQENIGDDVIELNPDAPLLRAQRKSHIAFNEGLLGDGNYSFRVTRDFLETAMKMKFVAIYPLVSYYGVYLDVHVFGELIM